MADDEKEVIIRIKGKAETQAAAAEVRQDLKSVVDAVKQQDQAAGQATEGYKRLVADGLKPVSRAAKEISPDAKAAAQSMLGLNQEILAQVPAAAESTKGLKALSSELGMAALAAGAMVGAFVATNISQWMTESMDLAASIKDIAAGSNQTTDEVQELEYAGKKVGMQFGETSELARHLAQQVATGDTSVRGAFRNFGLELETVRQKRPAEIFTDLIEMLGRVEDPTTQSGLAFLLFGERADEALRLAKDGLRGVRDEAHEMNEVIGKHTIDALADADRTFDQFFQHMKIWKAEGVAPFVETMNAMFSGTWWERFTLFASMMNAPMTGGPGTVGGLSMEINAEAKKRGGGVAGRLEERKSRGPFGTISGHDIELPSGDAGPPAPFTNDQLRRNYLSSLKDATVASLSAADKRDVLFAREKGQSEAQLSKNLFLDPAAVHSYLEAHKKEVAAEREHAQALAKLTEADKGLTDAQRAIIDGAVKEEKSIDLVAKANRINTEAAKRYVDHLKERKKLEEGIKGGIQLGGTAGNGQAALASMDRWLAAKDEEIALEQRLADLHETGLTTQSRRLEQIEKERQAELRKYDSVEAAATGVHGKINAIYDEQKRIALKTSDTIVQRKRQEGVYTKAVMDQQVLDAKRDYDAMLASHEFTTKELIEQWEKYEAYRRLADGDVTGEIIDNLGGLVTAFSQLSQIKSLKGFTQDAGAALGVAKLGLGSVRSLQDEIKKFQIAKGNPESDFGDLFGRGLSIAASSVGVAGALFSFVSTVADMFDTPEYQRVMQDIGRRYGVSISEGLANEVTAHARQLRHAQQDSALARVQQIGHARPLAELLDLDKVINEAGGLNASNTSKFFEGFQSVFQQLEDGLFTSAQAAEVLDENFETFATRGTDRLGFLNAGLREMIRLNDEYGTHSKAIDDYRKGQYTSGLQGLKALTENGTITSPEAALGVGGAVSTFFAELIASGADVRDVLGDIGPIVTDLQKELEAAGIDGGAAFQSLQQQVALASDELVSKYLTATHGAVMAAVALDNTHKLTQETFNGLARSVADYRDKLLAEGKDANGAMALQANDLQALWQLWKDNNYQVDEHTRQLLEDAEAAGVVGEAHRPVQEQMLAATLEMKDAVVGLAEVFGVKLPQKMKDGVDQTMPEFGRLRKGIADVIDGVPREIRFKIFGDLDMPTMPDGSQQVPSGGVDNNPFDTPSAGPPAWWQPEGYAAGGVVSRHKVVQVAERQPEIIGDVEFMTQALIGAQRALGTSVKSNDGAHLQLIAAKLDAIIEYFANLQVVQLSPVTMSDAVRAPGGVYDIVIAETHDNNERRGEAMKNGLAKVFPR